MNEPVTRRGWLGALFGSRQGERERKDSTSSVSFTLERFYAGRAEAPPSELPRVVRRGGLLEVETTCVGVCPPIEPLDDGGKA